MHATARVGGARGGPPVVIPAPFEYEPAESLDHAIALLGQYGSDAKLIAGGQSLLPLMKQRRCSPTVLIDIGRVRELAFIRDDGDSISVGALTTQQRVANDVVLARACGIVSLAAAATGDVQVRNRGTIGGSAAHA